MNRTQDHIPISDIKTGIVLLKDGGAVLILRVSAVNFGLLSVDEQMAIIGSFAQMLNSLSFAIQIVILSKRLDISSYISLLDKELTIQTNPLLAEAMVKYRQFVQSLIRENEVLDKSFYIAIPVSRLELSIGVLKGEELIKKAKLKLLPRRDQVARQLNRVGLKTSQDDDKQLLQLFYSIYNPSLNTTSERLEAQREINLNPPQLNPHTILKTPPQNIPSQPIPQGYQQPTRNQPFVVEELLDTI